jgi:hypothetical protein
MWNWFFGGSDDTEPSAEQDLAGMILDGIVNKDLSGVPIEDISQDQIDAALGLSEIAYPGEDWLD